MMKTLFNSRLFSTHWFLIPSQMDFIFLFLLLLLGNFLLFPFQSHAILWSGGYNVEGYYIQNPELKKENAGRKSYLTHHFNLQPKIILSDGVTLNARLDFLNGKNGYLGSVVGSKDNCVDEDLNLSCSNNDNGDLSSFKISALYLNFVHEFGALVIGKVPIHFGLGITHNSAENFFDHWISNRNIIGYKIKTNRFLYFPMIAKISEGDLDKKDDLRSLLFQGEYKNEESLFTLSVFYEYEINQKKDKTPTEGMGRHALSKMNVYTSKEHLNHKFQLEAAFRWGEKGFDREQSLEFSLFGFALEYQWKPKKYPRMTFDFWSGVSELTDKNQKNESYLFNRNYDVAFLLFNHPLGEENPINPIPPRQENFISTTNRLDDESLTNAFYLSPRFSYKIYEKWSIQTVLTKAWLWKNVIEKDGKKDLGLELDFNVQYQHRKNVVWKTEFGVLFPGDAFKYSKTTNTSGTSNKESVEKDLGFSYGLSTKISILF